MRQTLFCYHIYVRPNNIGLLNATIPACATYLYIITDCDKEYAVEVQEELQA